jgi:type I restriction enzyme M protein
MAPITGRVAVVVPQGALFRGGAEARIREAMIDGDLVEAVIGLAPNLFYGTGLAAIVLMLRATKSDAHRGRVLFINGETLFKRGRNQNTLESDHAAKLLNLYAVFTDEIGLAHVANLDEIKSNKYNLNIAKYVAPDDSAVRVTLDQALTALAEAQAVTSISRKALEDQLAKWSLT